jgi:hypothetical protein
MAKTTKKLIKILDAMISITEWDDSGWATWLSQCKNEIENGDFHGIERLLGGYGGMGSFNDLVVGQSHDGNGNFIWRKGWKRRNSMLSRLRLKAYEMAQHIKHNHDIQT